MRLTAPSISGANVDRGFKALLIGTALVGSLATLPSLAFAQSASLPVERNLPPQVAPSRGGIVIGTEQAGSTDTRPLGVNLRSVRLIGRDEQAAKRPSGPSAVTIGAIGVGNNATGAGVPEADLRAALAPFIGKPLSMALIAQAQAKIAGVYKAAGYPFVSVTIPPQEVTSGALSLRVVEFGFGKVLARGVEGAEADRVTAQMRAAQGERIEADRVNEDLRWLNRYPYRRVEGVFSPGDALGHSDITLDITPQKPWQVFAGYSNTGNEETDKNRIFFGTAFGLPFLNDGYASWQTTGSPDLFESFDRLFSPDDRAQYLSHSGRIVLPTFARQAIEISPSFVATRQTQDEVGGTFTFDNDVFELPIYYRSAVSNLLPGAYLGDISFGVDFKTMKRTTFFSDTEIGSSRAEVFQFGLGWDDTFTDRLGSTSISLMAKANPGGVLSDNTDRDWSAYSNGRVTDVSYAYLNGTLTRDTALGAGFSLNNELSFQIAGQALPDTEQMSLGGLYAVRGYGLEGVSADSGIVLRNELRLPAIVLPGELGAKGVSGAGAFTPFTFLDGGIGRDRGTSHTARLAGIGAGIGYQYATNVSMNLTAGVALTDEGKQDAGDIDLKFRLYISY